MRLVALLAAGILSSCADDTRRLAFEVGNVSYEVPVAHVQAFRREPQFIRLKDPDRSFDLVYDSRSAGAVDARGWPTIFSLNDAAAPDTQRMEHGGHKIVCRTAAAPEGGCGFIVVDRSNPWAVIFPPGTRQSPDELESDALVQLEAYQPSIAEVLSDQSR